jgi:hypothetical protein
MPAKINDENQAICRVTAHVMRVAPSNATVLITVRVEQKRRLSLARFTRGRVDPGQFSQDQLRCHSTVAACGWPRSGECGGPDEFRPPYRWPALNALALALRLCF